MHLKHVIHDLLRPLLTKPRIKNSQGIVTIASKTVAFKTKDNHFQVLVIRFPAIPALKIKHNKKKVKLRID